jgi:hypothetical protein
MGRRALLRGKNSSKWKPRPTTETLSSLMKAEEEENRKQQESQR